MAGKNGSKVHILNRALAEREWLSGVMLLFWVGKIIKKNFMLTLTRRKPIYIIFLSKKRKL